MSDLIIRGARQHNLRGVDLDLPPQSLIVFTGVSGSGKSSLAMDTLHAEGRRRYVDALGADARRIGARLRRAEVDAIVGLPPTVALEQRRGVASAATTVGSAAEILPVLRVLFARSGVQHCPQCAAAIRPTTHDGIVAALLALPAGSRVTVEAPVRGGSSALEAITSAGFSRVRCRGEIVRIEDVRDPAGVERVVVDRLRIGEDRRDRLYDAVRTTTRAGQGVLVAVTADGELQFTDRPRCVACDLSFPALEPSLLSWRGAGACAACRGAGEAADGAPCPDCGGARLSALARAVRWQGWTFHEVIAWPIARLADHLAQVPTDAVSALPVEDLRRRLAALIDLGLGALPLARRADRLSAGEQQRLRLARQVGSGLTGILYVLDEPSAGLSGAEVAAVVRLLRRLRDLGNRVIAVDHHPDVIAAADRIVEFGPGAGRAGGRVVYAGDRAGLLATDTATGRWLSGRERLSTAAPVAPTGVVQVRGAEAHGLRFDLDLPTGALVAIVGPSGSGKSTLVARLRQALAARIAGESADGAVRGLEAFDRFIECDDSPLGRSGRSMPATVIGLWDVLRELLAATTEAKIRSIPASAFSLAQPGGRCEACQGAGSVRVELGLLPEVWVPCGICGGRRFAADVLEITWKGRAADEILAATVAEARVFLGGHPQLDLMLRSMEEVGLGYLPLGQAAHTLSGGEAQRLRLARELVRAARGGARRTVLLVDDPTVGLHPADVAVLLGVFRRWVAEGATVWVATHHEPLAEVADARVNLG